MKNPFKIFTRKKKYSDQLLDELRFVQDSIADINDEINTKRSGVTHNFYYQSNYYKFCELLQKLLDGFITPEDLLKDMEISPFYEKHPLHDYTDVKLDTIYKVSEYLRAVYEYLMNANNINLRLSELKQRESEIKRELNIK